MPQQTAKSWGGGKVIFSGFAPDAKHQSREFSQTSRNLTHSIDLIQRQFGLSRKQEVVVDGNRRLLGLMAIGNQSAKNIDKAIDWRAMTRMLDLRNVFQLVDNRFDNGALAQ